MTPTLGGLLLALVAVGCQSQVAPTANPTAIQTVTPVVVTDPPAVKALTPTPSPTPATQLPCGTVSGVWDPVGLDIANLVPYYDTVVLATVTGYGQPFWNTPDRAEPSYEDFRRGSFAIQTPVDVRDPTLLRGRATPDQIVIPQLGKVGCVEFDTVTEVPKLGQEYVMFLAADGGVWVIWPVMDGVAKSGDDGPIPVDEIANRLEAAATSPPPSR